LIVIFSVSPTFGRSSCTLFGIEFTIQMDGKWMASRSFQGNSPPPCGRNSPHGRSPSGTSCVRALSRRRGHRPFPHENQKPQTNGIVERFHKTILNEFYRITFRKKLYGSIKELQADLDQWLEEFNRNRPHQGRWCFGKTPMQTFLDAKPIAEEKMIAA
jgi:hypothetical protein